MNQTTLLSLSLTVLAGGVLSHACFASDATDETPFVDASETPPPGVVAVEGGRVQVGSDTDTIEEVLEMRKSYHGQVRLLDAETPKYMVNDLGAFGLGKFEVTNEQYLAFIEKVDRTPPDHWGVEAIAAARQAFLEAEGVKMNEARAQGKKYEMREWTEETKEDWWQENWRDADWAVPEGDENKPVVYVDYEDVVAYCDWAGLRLPSEEEWVAAARGSSDDTFPWGDEWDATERAQTMEVGPPRSLPVGSFPKGATEAGIFDLAGSVWEWTSSSYNAFPGFRVTKYKGKVGKDKFELSMPSDFRSNQKVIKGGGYGVPLLAARVTFRQGTMKSQTAEELGFRVASSMTPAADRARAEWDSVLRRCPARKDDALLDYDNIAGIDRWKTKAAPGERPEGYTIIDGYEAVAFVPRAELELKHGGEIDTASRSWPVTLGALITSRDILEPALPAGSYLVMYRSNGKWVDADGIKVDVPGGGIEAPDGAEPTLEQQFGQVIDTDEDLLVFCDAATGKVVATIEHELKKDDRIAKVELGLGLDRREVVVGAGVDRRKETQDWLQFEGRLPVSGGRRALPVTFELRVETDSLGTGWRR